MAENPRRPILPDAARLFSKYAFYFSLAVFLYADLFPFQFDFSWRHLSLAWSKILLIPYWNARVGLHFDLDDLANLLLTIPIGFAGFLHYPGRRGMASFCKWGALGLSFGTAAELVQLAIPLRVSVMTDAINNGFGAFLGAATASIVGQPMLKFFTGTGRERRNVYLWMVIGSLMAMLGPYDLGPNSLSRLHSNLQALQAHPWESGALMGKDWVRMAGFAMIGTLAIRLAVPGRRRPAIRQSLTAASLVLLLPVVLECARLVVESDGPSLTDLALDIFAALAGAFSSLFVPQLSLAFSGFLVFNVALIAAGLSPYHFSIPHVGASFQWIPFYEFCNSRTSSSFYELIWTLFSSAVLGGLLQLSFPLCKGRQAAGYALILFGAMELAHMFLPAHRGNVSGILVASLGAWIGAFFCAAVEAARSGQISIVCDMNPNRQLQNPSEQKR